MGWKLYFFLDKEKIDDQILLDFYKYQGGLGIRITSLARAFIVLRDQSKSNQRNSELEVRTLEQRNCEEVSTWVRVTC